ncbi:MAG: LPS assembly lipoprotein LptE [Bacteroidales bacterium]|nr:LPS assembly lipoprotein LptE [Bacteroidales bacterium]MCI1784881.1 LPS assembly lipoprotein LptE [Bacteroidales bacterium]
MKEYCKISSYLIRAAALFLCLFLCHSCGIYSFSGTSIQPDVKTVTIDYFEYKALRVNPSLSNDMTESLKDEFKKMTRLEQVSMDGDIEIAGEITGYDVRATAVTADEVASKNRLTVTIKVTFTNRKYPEDNFEKSFSQYSDYDSTKSLDSVESTLTDEIVEKLVDDIFNATVANW